MTKLSKKAPHFQLWDTDRHGGLKRLFRKSEKTTKNLSVNKLIEHPGVKKLPLYLDRVWAHRHHRCLSFSLAILQDIIPVESGVTIIIKVSYIRRLYHYALKAFLFAVF
jgi:hypothetical protein